MYILYLDDSGSKDNVNEDYLVLAGLSIFERQIHWITEKLDRIASSIYPEDPSIVEFHASAIFGGRETPWKGIRDKSERVEIIKQVLDVLATSHESVAAFGCAVHKRSYPDENPVKIAFEELCNRFDLQLKRLYHKGENHRGIIVLDENSYQRSLEALTLDFRQIGTRWREIKNLPEIPMFVDSKLSRLVQLADHIAYAVFRYYNAEDNKYFNIISNRFDTESGKIHGLVHKQTVKSECMCPACITRRLSG